MSPDELAAADEQFSAWLAACDEALAAGADPPLPDEALRLPELRRRLERGLAGLQRPNRRRPAAPPPAPPPPPPGPSLGRFRLRRELGRGGFGVVYLAYDPVLGREVAVKVPHAERALTPELRERFRREARAASGLDHPNLVPVYEVGEEGP